MNEKRVNLSENTTADIQGLTYCLSEFILIEKVVPNITTYMCTIRVIPFNNRTG